MIRPLSLLLSLVLIIYMYFFLMNILTFASVSNHRSYPDIFLLGTSKSCTTELYHLLIQHPQICKRSTKEIHFFDDSHAFNESIPYKEQFRYCSSDQLTIDGTPRYFRDNTSFQNFKRYYSPSEIANKKFILILRDPIGREVSWYHHVKLKCLLHGNIPKARYECLANKTIEKSESFEQYLRSHRFDPWGSKYFSQLRRWLTLISRQQLFVVQMQTFLRNTTTVLSKIFLFLNISSMPISNNFEERKLHYRSSYNSNVGRTSLEYLRQLYKNEMLNLHSYLKGTKTPYEMEFECFLV